MLAGRIRYVDADFSGSYNKNDDVIELGRRNRAFTVNDVVPAHMRPAAMAGTLAHEVAHRRDPWEPGDPQHVYGDKFYQVGWGCAGFEYTR